MSITADDIMTNRFLRISTAHTLREALGLVLYGEDKGMDTGAIVVIDEEGAFAGILTPDALVKGLTRFEAEDKDLTREELHRTLEQCLPRTIDSAMLKDLPRLDRDTAFSRLLRLMGKGGYECLPVLEDHRVVGLIYATDVFRAAANLALTPGQEGIQVDRR